MTPHYDRRLFHVEPMAKYILKQGALKATSKARGNYDIFNLARRICKNYFWNGTCTMKSNISIQACTVLHWVRSGFASCLMFGV